MNVILNHYCFAEFTLLVISPFEKNRISSLIESSEMALNLKAARFYLMAFKFIAN
jgi:hypothetical protein